MEKIKNYLTCSASICPSVAFSNPASGQTVTYPNADGFAGNRGIPILFSGVDFHLPELM